MNRCTLKTQFQKWTKLQGKINSFTIILENLSTSLSYTSFWYIRKTIKTVRILTSFQSWPTGVIYQTVHQRHSLIKPIGKNFKNWKTFQHWRCFKDDRSLAQSLICIIKVFGLFPLITIHLCSLLVSLSKGQIKLILSIFYVYIVLHSLLKFFPIQLWTKSRVHELALEKKPRARKPG